MAKLRVAVIFGGRSGEHEVSLMSAKSVIEALDKDKYEVVPIGITREGKWLLTGDPMRALAEGIEAAGGTVLAIPGDPAEKSLVPLLHPGGKSVSKRTAATGTLAVVAAAPGAGGAADIDVVFPVLHGPYGEDGTIQGLLEMADLPYVGSGVLGSAVGMDKAMMKAAFRQAGLPVGDYAVVMRHNWERPGGRERIAEELAGEFVFPFFVKPANLGSSVGISKVHGSEEIIPAIDEAARYDRKIIVEEGFDAREIECSVLGNDEPIASVPGEILPAHEFYDYEAKYFDDRSGLVIPADLPPETTEEVRRLAVEAFLAVDAAGLGRVDFFVERATGKVYVNEINTMPGFTRISMYPKLWAATGIPYSELLDRLIQLALERYRDQRRNLTAR